MFGSARMPAVTADPDPLASTASPQSSLLFGAVLAACWPWGLALHLFAGLGRGAPGTDGYSFIPYRGQTTPAGTPYSAASVVSSADPSRVMTILFDAVGVVLLSCTRAVFCSAGSLRGPVPA